LFTFHGAVFTSLKTVGDIRDRSRTLATRLGLPAKAAIAAGVVVAAAAGVVFALAGDDAKPEAQVPPRATVAAPAVPDAPPPPLSPVPDPPAPKPPVARAPVPSPRLSAPRTPSPSRSAAPSRPAPAKPSPGRPTPSPSRHSPTPAPSGYQLVRLEQSVLGDHSGPEVVTWRSSWVWQRWGLVVGDRRFGHGITVNARSSVEIALNRTCGSFSARAGVDGLSLPGDGTVRFSVYGDGVRLWRSGAVGYGDPAVPVQVGLSGRKTLRLVVEHADGRADLTLAAWADSVISCR
ncbi:NPCBM/NEW2 domain-containing protein, partial [Streptomyces sp. NPDC002138]|uniref:NPCBM/NEW2 domain-containing protein n=1 Tax=Streptomyces sp. NPDC002138 TaxID=3154410 RepID=UPI003316682C